MVRVDRHEKVLMLGDRGTAEFVDRKGSLCKYARKAHRVPK